MTTSSTTSSQALGISFENDTATLRVYSETASWIQLCILEPDDTRTTSETLELIRGDDAIWQVTTDLLKLGTKYALKADGPEGPNHGFNKNLYLIDPYAKAVVRDSAREYHCVVIDDAFDWQGVQKPFVPMSETIVYEAHARGLTRGNDALPDELRGTYAALGHETTIAHLKQIGVTSVELLPIHMFISEPRLMNMGLINYWGYNTINFFSPHPRYATAAAREAGPAAVNAELKTAIRELHRAGIEVLLDVVYNHTAEGGGGGLTYSYRGLDNANYYRQDAMGNYQDTTGCGNSLNFGNPHVIRMVLDSLRYWCNEMQVDGFRFDLATTLARNEINHFDRDHPLFSAIKADPELAKAKMIVEPWDVGLGGWQTGNFPDGFSEWNDRYRDSVRRFWLTDIGSVRNGGHYGNSIADLATRLAGSNDVVNGPLGPLGAVNFITAHDGFTLKDLVSYNVKHNQINGESNRDGTNNNYSYNHGSEGEATDPSIYRRRQRAMRNLLGTMFFSAGIPMVTAGDERAKTQLGNNNAYCQDSKLSWVNWKLTPSQQEIETTFAFLTKLRRENPVLRPSTFGNFEELRPGSDRIRWYNFKGELMTEGDWHNTENRCVQRLTEHLDENGVRSRMLLIINGTIQEQMPVLPAADEMIQLQLLWDSYEDLPTVDSWVFEAGASVVSRSTSMQLLKVIEEIA